MEIVRALIGRVHLDDVWREARARYLNDTTGTSLEEHVLRVTLEAAAAVISETIAERDSENARLRQHIADSANRINVAGSAYDDAMKALDRLVRETKRDARVVLFRDAE